MKARNTIVRTLGAALGAGALAWLAVAGQITGATAPVDSSPMKPIAEEGPGYAIEDSGYPNADKSADEQGRDFMLMEIRTSR